MEIETKYLSAGINKTKRSLDWCRNTNLIAYAAQNRLIIYDPQLLKVSAISNESHGSYISYVQWIHNKNNHHSHLLLSLSIDGSAQLWFYKHLENSYRCVTNSVEPFVTLTDNKNAGDHLSAGCAVLFSTHGSLLDKILVVAAGDNNRILGWIVNSDNGSINSTFCYKLPGRSLLLDLILIPTTCLNSSFSYPLIVYGGDDGKLHFLSSKGVNYQPICSLAGHQDWIMSLDYTNDVNNDVLITSGSKDGIIRLWRLSANKHSLHLEEEEALKVEEMEIEVPLNDTDAKLTIFCYLESVLHGHDGLVSHLNWSQSNGNSEGLQLLSCSKTEDRSIILWEPERTDSAEGVWFEKARLGEVGGNREGFFNVKFGPNQNSIAATSYQGGLHLWHLEEDSWCPQAVVSGHFNEVVDLDWDWQGRFLITASKDQTTRLHALYARKNQVFTWQEIARPQVHGYDMACLVQIGKYSYVSGAEEKVIRGFTATVDFLRNLSHVSNVEIDFVKDSVNFPETASVPSLGLSNKAGEEDGGNTNKETTKDSNCVRKKMTGPPNEDQLMLGTLWPEVCKLYGHGNELLSLAATSDGALLASSCRGTNELDSKIIIWNTKDWKEIQSLILHRLSVTQLMFSSCDRFLLSVSRDRSWTVFEKKQNVLVLKFSSTNLDKKVSHSRIIWSCCWIPNTLMFVTGSRDKTVAFWSPTIDLDNEEQICGWQRTFVYTDKEEVTAVSAVQLSPTLVLIAIGSANGGLSVLKYDIARNEILSTDSVPVSHVNTIRRLKFSPRCQDSIRLASCGNDNAVFIYEIKQQL